jgi:hypothetical protein
LVHALRGLSLPPCLLAMSHRRDGECKPRAGSHQTSDVRLGLGPHSTNGIGRRIQLKRRMSATLSLIGVALGIVTKHMEGSRVTRRSIENAGWVAIAVRHTTSLQK